LGVALWPHGSNQARRYLDDPDARSALASGGEFEHQRGKSALEILGSPDDLKFRSCLTLFRQAASDKDTKPKTIAPHK
jgi:uncharacterized protein (DUF1810 family)